MAGWQNIFVIVQVFINFLFDIDVAPHLLCLDVGLGAGDGREAPE